MSRLRFQFVLFAVAFCLTAAMLASGAAGHPGSPWTRAGYAALVAIAAVAVAVKAGLKPKNLRFRLRTLLIAVVLLTIPCSYVGWQYEIVRERKATLRSLGRYRADWFYKDETTITNIPYWKPPLIRRWFGDISVMGIRFPKDIDLQTKSQVMAKFPEAEAWDYDMLPWHNP